MRKCSTSRFPRFFLLLATLLFCSGLSAFTPFSARGAGNPGQVVVGANRGIAGASPNQTAPGLPANRPELLQGKYCNWSGSSGSGGSFSSTRWAKFDGRGHFIYGSGSSYSGNGGSMYNDGADGGGTYEVRGNRIILHYRDGSSDLASVYNRAANGMITEVMYDGALYATALCE